MSAKIQEKSKLGTDIIIKSSKIHGKGLFARRDFRKGEIVLRWKPKVLGKAEAMALDESDRRFTFNVGEDRYYFMQEPERYMNHSCENNTTVQNDCDVAIRDIAAGGGDYGELQRRRHGRLYLQLWKRTLQRKHALSP